MLEFHDQVAEPVAAATVIVCRDGVAGLEALLLQRNPDIKNMGGTWVFPGGKVEPDDPGSDEVQRARCAAIREVAEETGLTLCETALQDFSHWLTPVVIKRRFSTWFYLARYDGESAIRVDGSEIVDYRWVRPEQALDEQERGILKLPPPTLVSLADIARFTSFAALAGEVSGRSPPRFFPRIIKQVDEIVMLYPDDVGYDSGDPNLSGPQHRTYNRDGRFYYIDRRDQA